MKQFFPSWGGGDDPETIKGSSPNSLMAKELECSKCSVIPESRKKNQIAGNHEALGSSRFGRGFPPIALKFSFLAPAAPCGTQAQGIGTIIYRRCLRRPAPAGPFFRAFTEFSSNIRSMNLEMNPIK